MKKLLNTLYVATEGASLSKDGENVVVRLDDAERGRVPLHMLAGLVVFGPVFVSPALIGACAERGLTVTLLDRQGRFQARIEGPVSGNVLLRRTQYRRAEAPEEIVRGFLLGKLGNQRAVLMRALRDHSETLDPEATAALADAARRIALIMARIEFSELDLDALRGAEGDAAGWYFSVFDHLIRVPEPAMRFSGRSRRPPRDAINALLSFLYTLLVHECRSGLEAVGLDPAVGFLHRDRPGRPSLALDLMEELRPIFADRLALALVNRRQIGPADFETRDGGAVWLSDAGRKTVLTAWQDRKKDERRHDFLDETAPLGLVPFLQAQLLSRHLRGDLDGYPPWVWK
ncbi:CRISPR-associated protein, Cas1 family [Devosia enhydra]|uniref:CRISPR-associated endonuclease Cas1 n=1 Tax=Devosia enhydra TaxID=665118 RepID=A0A1K2I3B7_9HYPH|nr:type I-C CRISPR-associated endonuclease Cas1c [Devosia enhydra]SFZ86886.1 CRISPR-associated protein, Cas1 family [Devosia enhydra]